MPGAAVGMNLEAVPPVSSRGQQNLPEQPRSQGPGDNSGFKVLPFHVEDSGRGGILLLWTKFSHLPGLKSDDSKNRQP